MKKLTGAVIGVLCLVVGAAVCYYVEQQACEKRIQQVREELAPTPVPEALPTVMKKVTIEVNSLTKPKIPFIEIPYTDDAKAPNGHRRLVTFSAEGGTATFIVPLVGAVNPDSSALPSNSPLITKFRINEGESTTLEINEPNEEEIEVYYQILCNDGTHEYRAEGNSPPRMQIPPV